jgi:hypothetical protein
MEGNNASERNNTGVGHSGFGGSVAHEPDKPEESKTGIVFPKQRGLLKDHWRHIHKMMVSTAGAAPRTVGSRLSTKAVGAEISKHWQPE